MSNGRYSKTLCMQRSKRIRATIREKLAPHDEIWKRIRIEVDDVPCLVERDEGKGCRRWTLPITRLIRVDEIARIGAAAGMLVIDVEVLGNRRQDGDVLMLYGLKPYEDGRVGPGRKRMMMLPNGMPLITGPGDKEARRKSLLAWIRKDWREAVAFYGDSVPAEWLIAPDGAGLPITHIGWKLEPGAGPLDLFAAKASDGRIVVGRDETSARRRRDEYEEDVAREPIAADEVAMFDLAI